MVWYIKLNPVGNCDTVQYFSGWLHHRADMPEILKQTLTRAGVDVGESAPIFTSDPACMRPFPRQDIAEKTAIKIVRLFPDFYGELTVKRLEVE